MSQLLLNPKFYRGCFDRIIYISQSASVDSNLLPLKKYCEEELEQREPCLYDEFDADMLRELLDEQLKLVKFVKKNAEKKGKRTAAGFQVCLVCDDYADSPAVMRRSGGILNTLAMRGRHANLSCFVLTQKYRALAPEFRLSANALFFFGQRSSFDLQAFLEENSAIVPRRELEMMYRRATASKFGFLYVNLMENRFFSSFKAELIPPTLRDVNEQASES